MIDLRLGDYRDVLADVMADHTIVDTPFSERTHKGALSTTGEKGVAGYGWWSSEQAVDFVRWCHARTKGWIVILNDDVLGPLMRDEMAALGRRGFPLLPVLQHMPNIVGDGPAPPGCFAVVSRPREKRFLSWGSLPGWYECGRDGSFVRGGKPLDLMRAVVRNYSRGGDLVMDATAGGATTLIAAEIEGRRAVGAELDPETHAKALARIARGVTPDLFAGRA